MSGAVTFLLTDVEGSTRLWERDPEVMRRALARHDELAARAIVQTGGSVVKPRGEGDSIFSVFDDAAAAVVGAVAFQRALEEEPWPDDCVLRTRAALHTGPVEVRDGDYYGPTVNRAARLRAIGHGRQVLLSHSTYVEVDGRVPGELEIRDLGVHRLKDLSEPEHVRQLYWPGLAEEFPPLASLHPHLTNLPSHGSTFVDREGDVAELEGLLGTARLVTLVGAAGVGKSRLATHVGAEVLDRFDDGVWHVDVAPLSDAAGIVAATAAVLGVRDDRRQTTLETLVARLAGRSPLLLLDNCEELRDECAELVRLLLAGCPETSVLATSSEPLGVHGEVVWETPPLPPSAAHELFAERAAASDAGSEAEHAEIEEICRRLAGVPLAIELAAAHGLDADGPEIEALLHEAHTTLSADERAALRRLSVFGGPFGREAALHVLHGTGATVETLDQLVDRALVAFDPAAPHAPYRLTNAVRPYARERLEDADEAHVATAGIRRALALALAAAGRLAIEAGDPERGHQLLAEAAALDAE